MATIPIYEYKNFKYVRTSDLSEIEREFFEHWLFGQTRPLIPDIDPQDAAYLWDYERYVARGGRPDSVATWD